MIYVDSSVWDDFCERSNEPSVSVRGEEFLDCLNDSHILEEDCASCELSVCWWFDHTYVFCLQVCLYGWGQLHQQT
jgi:hypothetical protein